ncbi:MAG TPA: type II secretion system secretin GspD [Acidiferrobacterales bacterium]
MNEFRLRRAIGLLLGASLVTVTGAVEMMPIPPSPVPDEQGTVEAPPPVDYQTDMPLPDAAAPPPPAPPPPLPPPGYAPPQPAQAPAGAPPVAGPAMRADQMLFNFQDADIQAVVKTVAQITGRNFLLDPRVKGRITIISAKPVSKWAAYEIFVSALKAQGFSAVEGPGGIVKLIPEAEAKQGAEVSGPKPRKSDQWVTQVVEIQFASAPQLIPLLRPLMSPSAMLSVYAPGNILVMTDTAASIRSVLRVIEKIDRRGSIEVTVIPLKHASVVDIAQQLGRFTEGAQIPGMPGQPQVQVPGAVGGDARLLVVPDLRTNSLLVRSDNPGRLEELKSLIEKLDVPAKGGGNTHVIYLRNAEAVKLAEVLRGLLTGESRAAAAAPVAMPGAAGAAAGRGVEASTIQADESTNALIISANDAVYNNLRAVIEKLDQRRAQVYVEALVVELTDDRATQFGIQWAAGTGIGSDPSGGAVAGLTNFTAGPGIIQTVAEEGANLAGANGLTLGFIGKEITLPDGTKVRGLGALVRAFEGDTKTNILSTPNLVMLDNAEGKIVVGRNVPFVTGSFAQATGTSGSAVNPFQTIERQDVGLTLKIKPQISEGGVVKLEIFQEVSSVEPSVQAADLVTNKRSIETTVLIDDGNIMVLGGLIEDRRSLNEQKVPLLGDIPLIGYLFKFRDNDKQKTNLMVFLRPVILRSALDSYAITADRYDIIMVPDARARDGRAALKERFRPVKPEPKETPAEPDDVIGSPTREGQLGPPAAPEAVPDSAPPGDADPAAR